MKTTYSFLRKPLLIIALSALLSSAASAADSIIAIGRISAGGNVTRSDSFIGATVSASRPTTGRFLVTIEKTGAFSGAVPDDFVPVVTCHAPVSSGRAAAASIDSLNDDTVTLEVRTSNVEDDSNTSGPEATNESFFFALHRLPNGTPLSPECHHLFATGRISSLGPVTSSVSADGSVITATRPGEGDYRVIVTKPGAFADDSVNDYHVHASPWSSSSQDITIRGRVSDASSDDFVEFRIRTDDAQEETSDNFATSINETTHFVIYRVRTPANPDFRQSNLLRALGSVDGNTGNLIAGASSLPNASVSSQRDSEGNYRVMIESPGSFAGLSSAQLIPHFTLKRTVGADEVVSGRTFILDSDTLRIDVHVDDVEQVGTDEGTPMDGDFYFALFEANAVHQGDLRIGRKGSLSKMKGDGRYNLSGSGQGIRVRPQGARSRFFFAVENDGNLTEGFRLSRVGKKKGYRARIFQLSGGRKNVTGAVMKSGYTTRGVSPGGKLRFQVLAKLQSDSPRKAVMRLGARSENGTSEDRVKATLLGAK